MIQPCDWTGHVDEQRAFGWDIISHDVTLELRSVQEG